MWSLIPWKQNDQSSQSWTLQPVEREFLRIRNDFDRLFQSMWRGTGDFDLGEFGMGRGFDATDAHYVLGVEAPGFEAGDFDVQMVGDRLVVKAERKFAKDEQSTRRYCYGRLLRSFTLPAGAQRDGIEAQYRNGVLELRVPKDPEPKDIKKIAVKTA